MKTRIESVEINEEEHVWVDAIVVEAPVTHKSDLGKSFKVCAICMKVEDSDG